MPLTNSTFLYKQWLENITVFKGYKCLVDGNEPNAGSEYVKNIKLELCRLSKA